MLTVSLASRLTIVVTILFLGYNVFQLSNAHSWMVSQAGAYRAYVREQQIGIRFLRRFNLKVLGGVFALYAALLFFSGFAWWVLAATVIKCGISAWISDRFHMRVLIGKNVSRSTHRLMRYDALGNALLLSLVLLSVVFS